LTDIVVCRFGSTGGLDWSRIVDGPRHDYDFGDGIVLDATGDVLVSGTESGLNNRLNAVVLKYSADGTPLWTYTYQPNSNWETQGRDIAVATGGQVYVTAWRHNVTGGPYETMLMTLTPSGETLWTGADTASSESPWASLAVDTAGGAYVVGKVARTMRTWKYSASGALAWKADYSTIDTTSTYGVLATLSHDQGVYSTGYRFISEGGFAFLVVKYSAAGQHRWHVCAESMDNCVDRTVAAAVDPSDNLIVTGKSTHLEIQQDDFITMKFRASGAVEERQATPVEPTHVILASPSVVTSLCRFSVPAGERASDLSIADIAGRAVREIAVPAGRADERVSVTWDARVAQGRPVPNGVYFVRTQPQPSSFKPQASCKLIVQR